MIQECVFNKEICIVLKSSFGYSFFDVLHPLQKLISSAKRLILKLKREQFDAETSTGIDNMKKAVRLYDETFAEAVKGKKLDR